MRLIHLALISFACVGFYTAAKAASDEPTKRDYLMGQRYGYLKSDIYEAYLEKRKEVNVNKLNEEIKIKLSGSDFDRAALIDETLDNLISRAVIVLRYEGHNKLADDIDYEYENIYRFALTRHVLGFDEIGDHPPMSEWIDDIHKRIHEALGDMLCQYFRFHDLHILNFGIPVIFRPSAYDLKDYKDHFAGHLIFGWWFEHHGVAGVAAFWIVDGSCIAASYGLGIITFICTPIATFAQNVMDKRIAPPIAESIWKRAQDHN